MTKLTSEELSSSSSKRLAKNTLVLYVRMLLTVGISFYTTRVVLANLGVDDFGLYNVVGSVVSFSYIFTTSLTDSITRFITVEAGHRNLEKAKETFATSINILLISSLIVIIISETIGLWFTNTQLVFDVSRSTAVNWIFQFFVFSIVIEIMSVPFNALIIAYEKMSAFAFITILEVLLKLGVAFALACSPIDKLVYYGLLMCGVSFIRQIIYFIYCFRHFEECSYNFRFRNASSFLPMAKYIGLKILSLTGSLASTAGLGVVLNMFFPAYVNAARGIALQIQGQSTSFSRNFTLALNPQITKTYAQGNIQEVVRLVYQGSRIAFFLFLIVGFPLLLETDFFLSVWLKEVPRYTAIFVQLAMITQMISQCLSTFTFLNNAIGHIRKFEMQNFLISFLTLPASYFFLKLGFSPVTVPIIYLISIAGTAIPCFFANREYVRISVWDFFKKVILRILVVVCLSLFAVLPFRLFMQPSFLRLFTTVAVSVTAIMLFTFLFGLYPDERIAVMRIIKNRFQKIYKQ